MEQLGNHVGITSLFQDLLGHGTFSVASYYVIYIECQYRLCVMSNHKIRNNSSVISKPR